MKTPLTLATLVLAAGFALPALAQTDSTPRIDKREANQQHRIEQGERSGALTNKETARLEKGEARIDRMEHKATADGKVTRKERAHIEKAQNRESRRIYREKHDKQRAN